MRLILHGSLGDEVAVTGLVRALRRQRPRERLTVDVRRPELFAGNPHLVGGSEDDGVTVHLPLGGDGVHHLVDAYGAACGIVVDDTTPELFLTEDEHAWADSLLLPAGTIAVDIWSGWPSRRWPFVRFMALVDALVLAGHQVVEVGATVPDCAGATRSGPLPNVSRSFLDRASIRQTAALLTRCALFVGNDSGLAHLAAAVGTPSVVIFGPVKAEQRRYATTVPVLTSTGGCPNGCAEQCRGTARFCPTQRTSVADVLLAIGEALALRKAA